jgi:hypothetical protein
LRVRHKRISMKVRRGRPRMRARHTMCALTPEMVVSLRVRHRRISMKVRRERSSMRARHTRIH